MTTSRYWLVYPLIVVLVFTCPLLAQRVAMPDHLRDALRAVASSWSETKHYDEQSARECVQELYRWIETQTRAESLDSVLESLSVSLPIFTNEAAMSWKQRLGHCVTATNAPICVSVTTWVGGSKKVSALRVDYLSNDLRRSGYLKSTAPMILTSNGRGVTSSRLQGWKYMDVGSSTVTIHGFIGGSSIADWPDLLVSVGPVGTGSFVYLGQFHLDGSLAWTLVWETSFAYVAEVSFNEQASLLAVRYFSDKFDATIQEFVTPLVWAVGAQQNLAK